MAEDDVRCETHRTIGRHGRRRLDSNVGPAVKGGLSPALPVSPYKLHRHGLIRAEIQPLARKTAQPPPELRITYAVLQIARSSTSTITRSEATWSGRFRAGETGEKIVSLLPGRWGETAYLSGDVRCSCAVLVRIGGILAWIMYTSPPGRELDRIYDTEYKRRNFASGTRVISSSRFALRVYVRIGRGYTILLYSTDAKFHKIVYDYS